MIDYFTQWLGEYFSTLNPKLKRADPEYGAAIEQTLVLGEQLKPLLNNSDGFTLSKEDHIALQQYLDLLCEVNSRRSDLLYLQGYRDCLELLRTLEALSF